jgi:hypothetical protein
MCKRVIHTHMHARRALYVTTQWFSSSYMGKGKAVPLFNWAPRHEGVLGSGGIASRINLGTIWRWVVGFTARPLHLRGKSPWYPLDRRLGGSQSRSGCREEKNSQPLLGLEPPIIQPVAQHHTTELSWLLAHSYFTERRCVSYRGNVALNGIGPRLLLAEVRNR